MNPGPIALPSGRQVALGRRAIKTDPRTLRLARYLLQPSLPQPPLAMHLSPYLGRTPWGLYNNDRWGDCTAVGIAHQIMLDSAMLHTAPDIPTLADVINLYVGTSALDGNPAFDPLTGQHDDGALELDALNYWRKNAVAGVTLEAFARVDCKNLTQVRIAMLLMGGLYIGVNLPISAQAQLGKLWDVTDDGPDSAPGSWGGHAMNAVDYDWYGDQHVLAGPTWGSMQLMTEAFWLKYVDECWATLTTAWKVRAPTHQFNYELLEADLAKLAQHGQEVH